MIEVIIVKKVPTSYSMNAVTALQAKKKKKKNLTNISHVLHKFTVIGSILGFIQIVFIVAFILLLQNKASIPWMDSLSKNTLAISIIFSTFIFIDTLLVLIYISKLVRVSHKTDLDVASIIGQDVKEAYDFSRLGLAVVDKNDMVIWTNEFLSGRQINMLDMNIYSLFEPLRLFKSEEEIEQKTVQIKVNNTTFDVEYLRDSRLFLFRDVSDYTEEHEMALKEAIVIGKLVIDTYDELSKILETKKFNDVVIETHHLIDKYFSEHGALAVMSNDDEFLIISNFENFNKMREERFTLLETIRENSRGDDATVMTVSIGFAHGFNESIVSLESKATRACSTALRRGGDQIIVSDIDGQTVFGGTNKVQRQQNLVRYRTYAQSLSSSIREASKVIISGHKISDMDSLGSSLGFYSFVKTVHRNNGESIPAYVVFDSNSAQSNTLTAFQTLRSSGLKSIFITPNDVPDLMDDRSLIILTDVYNPVGSLLSKIFDRNSKSMTPSKVIVFDHHMKNTKDMEIAPILECVDPSISSCSEMVTHLLQYTEEDCKMNPLIADVLLSGIMLDTGFFKNRVDTTTYSACNMLVQRGAKSENASNMLKEAYETYQLKCSIGAGTSAVYNSLNFYISGGIHIFIICATDPKNPNSLLDEDILAKVADEHVATKDVDACFVIGKVSDNGIKVSCRGNGKYNVQRVAESFPDGYGGGEFDRAAVLFTTHGLTVEDVREKVREKILELSDLSDSQEA